MTNEFVVTADTAEKKRRAIQAIKETERALERAMRYQPQFRDNKLISFYEKHLEKLHAMVAA